jgi:hypothetical protein
MTQNRTAVMTDEGPGTSCTTADLSSCPDRVEKPSIECRPVWVCLKMTIICKKDDDDDDDGRSTGEVGLSKFQTNPRDVHGSEIFGNGVNVQ